VRIFVGSDFKFFTFYRYLFKVTSFRNKFFIYFAIILEGTYAYSDYSACTQYTKDFLLARQKASFLILTYNPSKLFENIFSEFCSFQSRVSV
jgi:hypothetical protein